MSSSGFPLPVARAFAFSAGLTTLVIELLWIRLAEIEVGGPLLAFTLIITCFMVGTAAGAFVLGRLADRTGSPLRIFGFSQIGVCLVGVVSYVAAASGGLARPMLIYFELQPGFLLFNMVLLFTHGAVSGAAAFMAGGSLPLLVKHLGPGSPLTARAGTLASFQAMGGAVGALLCGFVLLPYAGLRLSLLGMAGLTALTGLSALSPGARAPSSPEMEDLRSRPGVEGGSGLLRSAVPAALLVSGLALTMLEVTWTRLTALSFGSSAQAASIVLALVVAGLASGYTAGARLAIRTPRPDRLLGWLLAAGAVSILMGDFVLGRLPVVVTWIDTWLETASPLWQMSIARFAILLLPIGLPSLLLGAVYPLTLRLLWREDASSARDGRTTGLASALSAIGNMAGPPLAYFGIMGSLGSRGCLLLPAIALCLTALLAAPGIRRGISGVSAMTLCLLLPLCLTAAVIVWLPWDPYLSSSGPYLYAPYYRGAMERSSSGLGAAVRQRGDIIFSREGPDSLVTVRRSAGGLLSLQVNGKTDASTGGDLKTQALTAHLPLLVHAARSDARMRVLIVGLGSGVTAAAALTHPAGQVDVIEISQGVVAAASLFVQTTGDLGADPRMRLIHGDARTHLLFADARNPRYDVIASQPSNPWIVGQAILFTREFFELAAARLARGGVMCQWIQGQGLPARDFRSILATFAEVFEHISLWEESTSGGDYLLIGSQDSILIDEVDLVAKMSNPSVARDLARIEIRTPADLLAHHVASSERLRQIAHGADIQTEDMMSLEFTAPLGLHRESLGEILALLEPARAGLPDMVSASPSLSDELARRHRSARSEREWAAGLGLLAPSLQFDPDLVRAASYLAAGMRAHALEAIRLLALRSPSQRIPHLMAAHVLMSIPGGRSKPDLVEVIRELKIAVTLDPSEPYARLFLSRALLASGARQEALVENMAIAEPRPPEADSDRCAMFLESGDGASAEAACLEALIRDPELPSAHANLGVVRSRRGRVREAAESYRRALELDPTLMDTRYNLAALYERQGRHREGLELLSTLVSPPAPGTDAAIFLLAARLAVTAGDLYEARSCLRQGLARGQASAETAEIEIMIRNAEGVRNGSR